MSIISERLHDSIIRAGYSYGELAKLTGIPKSAIQRYATGETTKIPLDRLQVLADALHVSSRYLMDWEDPEENKPAAESDGLDPEMEEILERAKNDPHMRMLFSLYKDAKPEDVETAIKIIQALRGK